MVRGPVGVFTHGNLRERLVNSGVKIRPNQSHICGPECYVITDRRHKELIIRILKYHANTSANFSEVLLFDGQPGHFYDAFAATKKSV